MLTPWKESYDQPRYNIEKQRHYFAKKGPSSQGYGFSCGYVWMWELDCEESWAPKNWCFWTVVLEKTLESPMDCKEIQPVHSKGDQSWMFIGRTDAKAETPILWPPHAKSWFIGKDSDAGRDWSQEEKGTTEDEMAEWHHQLHEHEFERTPGVGDRQGGMLQFMGSQRVGHDWATELNLLNWIKLIMWVFFYCCCSVVQPCSTLCDPMDCSTPGFPVLQSLFKFMSIELVMPSDHLILWATELVMASNDLILWPRNLVFLVQVLQKNLILVNKDMCLRVKCIHTMKYYATVQMSNKSTCINIGKSNYVDKTSKLQKDV